MTLMSEYSSLLSDAVLRDRARVAEHSARIEAELASKVKSEFIANMSHELKTPLNTVIGFSKLLTQHQERRLPDREVVEYAALIHDAAGHLLSVINDILDISKLQSGKYAIDSREIILGNILAETADVFRNQAEAAQINFDAEIPSDLPLIRGDGAKLKQIFGNILANAIKFTPVGGNISINALRTPDQGAIIRLRDSGIGMSPDEIEVAMIPFGQVDGGRSRWREGAGLGLPIARALVELHGGTLEIRSEKQAGTEVIVILPGRYSVIASAVAFVSGVHNPAV
jgi:two-component system cell cycle sensor histidine kinase PleC